MGRLTVLLTIAGLFISVCASKVGGSYGHVKYRDVNVPKNIKSNLRTQQEASDVEDNDAQPANENPPDEGALVEEEQLNDENNVDAENTPNDDNQDSSKKAPWGGPNDPDNGGGRPPPEESSDIADEEDGELASRGITVGDTFTPHELLPVTRKLIEKVENPGEGTGIVSSAKSPEALADVLFESFFFGPRRIVTLEDKDVIGLDALQALALSGEEARRMYTATQVTAPGYLLNIEDQVVKVSPRASKYLLLRKSGSSKPSRRNKKKVYKFRNRKDKRMIKRRAPNTRQNLIKKLQKKRQLVLNPVRKNNQLNKTRVAESPAVSKVEKEDKSRVNPAHKNVKYDKTKAIKTSASAKINKGVKRKVNPARKNYKMNKVKVSKTVTLSKVNKGAKGTQSSKIDKKNLSSHKVLYSNPKETVAAYVPGKPKKGDKQADIYKNLNKSAMMNRIQGNHVTPRPSTTTVHRSSPLCRWRYECTNPGDLDSCKLHTQCNMDNIKASTNANFIGPVKSDEEMRTLRNFRKMLGVSPVDEEVEKILEARIMQYKPPVMLENPARIESLSQYFNNIIVAQLQSSTVAENSDSFDETTIANLGYEDLTPGADDSDTDNLKTLDAESDTN